MRKMQRWSLMSHIQEMVQKFTCQGETRLPITFLSFLSLIYIFYLEFFNEMEKV